MLKRTIAFFIAVFFVLSSVFAGAVAIKKLNELPIFSFSVISDTHVLAKEQIGEANSKAYLNAEKNGQKMLGLSEPILQTAIDNFIASDAPVLFVSGDITEDGARVAHLAAAREFQRAENAGKQVYVIPGNHDIRNRSFDYSKDVATPIANISPQDFYEIYYNFGYDDAIEQDNETLSYSVNLDRNFRLIAIDCSTYTLNPATGFVLGHRGIPSVTQELIDWTVKQVKDAYAAGKTPLGMIHFPLTNHLGDLAVTNSSKVNMTNEFSAALTKAGLELMFTGHLHANDIMTYEDESGTLYDIGTGCLTNYPVPVRNVTVSKTSFNISMTLLNGIKEEYIPEYYDANTSLLLKNNLTQYAYDYFTDSLISKILSITNTKTLESILQIFEVSEEDSHALAEDLHFLIRDILDMPLYGANSLESLCKKFEINIPKSKFNTVGELSMDYLKAVFHGDESITHKHDNNTLLKYSIYSVFYRLAEFDFFGKIHDLNENIPAVDLMPSMELLFKEGKLALVDNDLLLMVSKIEKLQNISFLSLVIKETSLGTWNALIAALNLYANIGIDSNAISERFGWAIDDIVALGIDNLMDEKTKSLNFNTIIDDVLFKIIGENIFIDKPPADNFLKVKRVNLP